MAEINVERRERSIWPWILGLLLLALLAWGIYELLDDDEVERDPAAVVVPVEPAVPPAGNP